MRDHALFGPGGNSESFYAAGYKSTIQAPKYLAELGLGAYEFEAGNGLNVGEKTLRAIGEEAKKYGIALSLHTPYFISLSGIDPEKRLKSVEYIQRSLFAAECLGATTIVVHSGSAAKISRAEAIALIQQASRRYAKRQLTWFRRAPDALWIEWSGEPDFDWALEKIRN